MASKSEIVFSIIGVMAFLTLMYSLLGGFINEDLGVSSTTQNNKLLDFNFNFIDGVRLMPLWFNTLIFGSLSIFIGWIIISSLPTINGGA